MYTTSIYDHLSIKIRRKEGEKGRKKEGKKEKRKEGRKKLKLDKTNKD
jgi:hypothetical protein